MAMDTINNFPIALKVHEENNYINTFIVSCRFILIHS